jgi:hypothetical protein
MITALRAAVEPFDAALQHYGAKKGFERANSGGKDRRQVFA